MEATLLSFVKVLGSELGSQTASYVKIVFCLRDERRKFMNTLSTIEAALMDLEMQHEKSHAVSDWYEKLHDILYDADDLVDDFAAKALQNQLATPMEKVFRFYSTVRFYIVSVCRLRGMRERLDDMAADRTKFHPMGLILSSQVRNTEREETHSYALETDVIGRNGDKKKVKELVMDSSSSSSSSSQENVSVIPIIGIAGVGKTTLAQLIYNDEEIQKHFELKMWVCVSDNFDLKLIVANIIESATGKPCEYNGLDQLQTFLREKIGGKRYLLVLDDLWNEDREKWLRLRELLMGGAKGSKIIAISRMEIVATTTSTDPPYVLAGLPEDMCWSLFSKLAFGPQHELEKPSLETIGKEILTKCAGNPLAIRAAAGVLYHKHTASEWLCFKNNELLGRGQNENFNVQKILKMSYDHLPYHLKPCFAYCSLFPKDYDLDKDNLIQLWMAQGFIRSSKIDQSLEDAGDEYFMDLCKRSFFQDVRRYEDQHTISRVPFQGRHKTSCRMHDLFHDLAASILGFSISLANLDAENVVERTRHVSFSSVIYPSWEVPAQLLNANKLRSFLLPVQSASFSSAFRGSSSICDTIVKRFRCLRVLDQHRLGIATVSSSIGALSHCRYLDLSGNGFASLPDSIVKLQFLETLKLSGCDELKELPRGISKLVNLRHLEINGCRSLTHMPRGLGQLTSLRTLTDFVVSKNDFISGAVGGLNELNGLNKLHGALVIRGLERISRVNIEEGSYLKGKEYLQSLTLNWGFSEYDWFHMRDSDNDQLLLRDNTHQLLLESLQPHPNLKTLNMEGYGGDSFPSWMMVNIDLALTHIVKIHFTTFSKCKSLPPFGQLPSLQVLTLDNLISVEYIADDYNHGDEDWTLSFPSLKEFKIVCLHNLEGWWRRKVVPTGTPSISADGQQLQQSLAVATPISAGTSTKPVVVSSSSFSSLPHSKGTPPLDDNVGALPGERLQCLISLEHLMIYSCTRLLMFPEEGLIDLPSLRFLRISKCESLTYLPRGMQNLESLLIDKCRNLDLSEDNKNHMQFQDLRKLIRLEIINVPKLVSIPAGLRHVTTLQFVRIGNCENFTTLPDWIGDITSLRWIDIWDCPNLSSVPPFLKSDIENGYHQYHRDVATEAA